MQNKNETEVSAIYSSQYLNACKNNNLQKVKELHENHCYDANIKSENGKWFGLSYAIYHNNLELVEFLLSDPNVDVNMVDDYSNSALMLACRGGQT